MKVGTNTRILQFFSLKQSLRGRQALLAFTIFLFLIALTHTTSAVTYINSCQTLNNAGETYRFNADITGATDDCLRVTADNIEIDGEYYALNHHPTAGSDADWGIETWNGGSGGVDELEVYDIDRMRYWGTAIFLYDCDAISGTGCNIGDSSGIQIRNSRQDECIDVEESDDLVIRYIDCFNNEETCISVEHSSDDVTIRANDLTCFGEVIDVRRVGSTCDRLEIRDNTLLRATDKHGIELSEKSPAFDIHSNTIQVDTAGYSGVYIEDADNGVVYNNTITSVDYGIRLHDDQDFPNNNQLYNNFIDVATDSDYSSYLKSPWMSRSWRKLVAVQSIPAFVLKTSNTDCVPEAVS
jgi:hypothetical protein